MDDKTFYRATLSLPADLAVELADTARLLGVSQSALVTHILRGPLGALALRLSVSGMPNATPDPVKRRRGRKPTQLVDEIVRAALDAADHPIDLFNIS